MNKYLKLACDYVNATNDYDAAMENDETAKCNAIEVKINKIDRAINLAGPECAEIVNAYVYAINNGCAYPVFGATICGFHSDPETIVSMLRDAGEDRFAYAEQSSATMPTAYALQRAGSTINGIVKIRKSVFADWHKTFEMIPAMVFNID